MKQFSILFTLLLFLVSIIYSQAQEILWQNTLGGNSNDVLYSISPTPDGGYICGGSSRSPISGDKSKPRQGKLDYWVIKLDSAGNKTWDKVQGGTNYEELKSIIPTTVGGYIGGGESQSGITGHKTEASRGGYDYWIIKLNSGGNIHWQKTIGGSSSEYFTQIIETTNNGYFIGGTSYSGISGEKSEPSQGYSDFWLLKLDPSGSIEWQNTIGGASYDELTTLAQTSDGGFICGGYSYSGISGDKTEASRGLKDYWIVKLDDVGNILWQRTFGGSGTDELYSIRQTPDGGYICGGTSDSGISGDKIDASKGLEDFWILKLDASGNLQWQKTIGGMYYDNLIAMNITSDGGYICGGNSSSPISSDKTEPGNGSDDLWIVKLDALGNIEWQNTIGGYSTDQIGRDIIETTPGNFIVGAVSQSGISGDKTEISQGSNDFWIINISNEFNSIKGKIFIDNNSDGNFNSGDFPRTHTSVIENTTGRISFTNANGDFSLIIPDSGNFNISTDAINHFSSVPLSHSATFQGFHETDSLNDFALQPIGIANDLQVTITPTSPFRPGFNASYYINYQNIGNTTLNATVILFPDSNLNYNASAPAETGITNDSIYWNMGNLSPFQSGSILANFTMSTGVAIGTLINSGVTIEPVAGDAQPTNNTNFWEVVTTGSYDPNDILVSRDTLYSFEISNPPYLEYIIRFQNTGTDTAFFVKILNNIDTTKLQLNTIQVLSASHPVKIRYIHWERNMEFKFDNILLPDSNINEPESHGYVRYRIKPKPNLLITDLIRNSAAIYFDFNDPVITNTATTRFVLPTGIESVQEEANLNVFPNPAKNHITIDISEWEGSEVNLELYDVFGQLISSVFDGKVENGKMKIEHKLHGLSSGIYIIRVSSFNGVANYRFVKM